MSRLKREGQMRVGYKLISALFAIALLGAPTAAQQPAKSGKYTGKYAVNFSADQIYELEKGHVVILGPLRGVFLNDVADGFLDKTEVICPRMIDVVGGAINAGLGVCMITDKDGDKAFLVAQAKGSGGTFKWTSGTGKYAGLQGNSTFHFTGIDKTAAGVMLWQGEWRLP
jgi:hypothetical protein